MFSTSWMDILLTGIVDDYHLPPIAATHRCAVMRCTFRYVLKLRDDAQAGGATPREEHRHCATARGHFAAPADGCAGTSLFDESEVEQIVRDVEQGLVTLWEQMRGASDPLGGPSMAPCADCSRREHDLALARAELEDRQRRHQTEVQALRTELERERQRHMDEQLQLEREIRRFVSEVARL
jgi:hypothetical protein